MIIESQQLYATHMEYICRTKMITPKEVRKTKLEFDGIQMNVNDIVE